MSSTSATATSPCSPGSSGRGAPVLLLQAQNDYSIGPSEILAPILKAKGPPSHSTVYSAFGTTNQHGHGAFAVLLSGYCLKPSAAAPG